MFISQKGRNTNIIFIVSEIGLVTAIYNSLLQQPTAYSMCPQHAPWLAQVPCLVVDLNLSS